MRPVQYFSDEYLQQCRQMTPGQILQFLEDFRLLFAAKANSNKQPSVAESPAKSHPPVSANLQP